MTSMRTVTAQRTNRIPKPWMLPEIGASAQLQVLTDYRSAPRTEACACGGFVVAGPSDAAVTEAVRRHQRTSRHRIWWGSVAW